jgi:hypothetical protein
MIKPRDNPWGDLGWRGALQPRVPVVNHLDIADDQPYLPDPTVQVFLAHAADPATAGIASEMAAVDTLRQRLSQAQIAWWEYPAP